MAYPVRNYEPDSSKRVKGWYRVPGKGRRYWTGSKWTYGSGDPKGSVNLGGMLRDGLRAVAPSGGRNTSRQSTNRRGRRTGNKPSSPSSSRTPSPSSSATSKPSPGPSPSPSSSSPSSTPSRPRPATPSSSRDLRSGPTPPSSTSKPSRSNTSTYNEHGSKLHIGRYRTLKEHRDAVAKRKREQNK